MKEFLNFLKSFETKELDTPKGTLVIVDNKLVFDCTKSSIRYYFKYEKFIYPNSRNLKMNSDLSRSILNLFIMRKSEKQYVMDHITNLITYNPRVGELVKAKYPVTRNKYIKEVLKGKAPKDCLDTKLPFHLYGLLEDLDWLETYNTFKKYLQIIKKFLNIVEVTNDRTS